MIKKITSEVADGIRQRFARAQEASRHADQSVKAGREYVAAYVEFIHYVENIHQALTEPVSHAHHEAQVAEKGLH